MIASRFQYYRPETLDEACQLYMRLQEAKKMPLYYGGGTEILTRARESAIRPDAVLDIKHIPECRRLEMAEDTIVFGAAVTLDEICRTNYWPLLSDAAGRVADHTTRCKITLGGHLAGTIPYREASLPFMIFARDAKITVQGPAGPRRIPLVQVYDGQLHLGSAEFVVDLSVPRSVRDYRGASVKTTRIDWVDYPLFTVTMVRDSSGVRAAFSGVLADPFTSASIDKILSGKADLSQRARESVAQMNPIIDDLHGSSAYRRFRLTTVISQLLQEIGE